MRLSLGEASAKFGLSPLQFVEFSRKKKIPIIYEGPKAFFDCSEISIEEKDQDYNHRSNLGENNALGDSSADIGNEQKEAVIRESISEQNLDKLMNVSPTSNSETICLPGDKNRISTEDQSLRIVQKSSVTTEIIQCQDSPINQSILSTANTPQDQDVQPSQIGMYDYPAKNLWRQSWIDFVKGTLTITLDSRVLCLGGYGDEIPFYQKVGFKDYNIIVVERDKDRAHKITERFPQVQVKDRNLNDVLSSETVPFDVVLLDYDGRLVKSIGDLELLTARNLLAEKSCLGVNYFAARESDDEQALIRHPYFVNNLGTLLDRGETIGSESIERSEMTFQEIRGHGLSAIVLQMLMGSDAWSINRSLRCLPSDERRLWSHYLENKDLKSYHDFLEANYNMQSWLQNSVEKQGLSQDVAILVAAYHARPFIIEYTQRFQYKTERGNNIFISDFYALDKRSDLYECMTKFSKFVQGKASIQAFASWYHHLDKKEQKTFDKCVTRSGLILKKNYALLLKADGLPERRVLEAPIGNIKSEQEILIGKVNRSLSKKPHRLSHIEIHLAYQLFTKGYTNEKILEQHPDWHPNSLYGAKAAYTRRKESFTEKDKTV